MRHPCRKTCDGVEKISCVAGRILSAPTLRRENTGSLFAFCHDCKLPEFLTRSRCQHHASVQPAELLVRLASGCRLGPGLPQESLIFLGPAVNQGTFFSWQKLMS
ncbi:uncharacterized protein LOC144582171 isoform X6 [Callithrix jacchus]